MNMLNNQPQFCEQWLLRSGTNVQKREFKNADSYLERRG